MVKAVDPMAQPWIARGKTAQAPMEGGITGLFSHEDIHSFNQSYIYCMKFLQIDAAIRVQCLFRLFDWL